MVKENKMNEGYCIRYVQFKTNAGIGYGCFAIDWTRNDLDLIYRMGMSFCNPKDNFSKHIARKVADGRLKKYYNMFYGMIQSNNTGYITDADFNNILNNLFYRKFENKNGEEHAMIPNYARKAFDNGAYSFTLSRTKTTPSWDLPSAQDLSDVLESQDRKIKVVSK